ncbi:MAG: TetR family transcriptional regulator [Solirubrobacterales bacterium]|jgi:AcrR family transcriptional regulator|nr:TetR family transcriptional regulator [Solirubrobacterales bacterium]
MQSRLFVSFQRMSATAEPARDLRRERGARTREQLLDATVACLVELGYSRTSMQEICTRAGVSRGAQLHHFPTKAGLMAAAVEHLTTRRIAQLRPAGAAIPPGVEGIPAMIDSLWQGFSGPLAKAALELWVASSTDPDLRESLLPVDRALGRATHDLYRDALGAGVPAGPFETVFWLTVNLTRGLALDRMIGGDDTRRHALLEEWKRTATAMVAAR